MVVIFVAAVVGFARWKVQRLDVAAVRGDDDELMTSREDDRR